MENNKKKTLLEVYAVLALVLVVGVTYAFITIVLRGEKQNTITGGELKLTLSDEDTSNGTGDSIMITDAFPMSDAAGKQSTKYYTFTLTNSSPKDAGYTIFLDEEIIDDPSVFATATPGETEETTPTATPTVPARLEDKYVKVYLTDDKDEIKMDNGEPKKVSDLSNPETERTVKGKTYTTEQTHILYSGRINAAADGQATTETFKLRMWIASDAGEGMTSKEDLQAIMGRYYATKISVDAYQIPEYAVTVINNYGTSESEEPAASETKAVAVFGGSNAVISGLQKGPEGKTRNINCTKVGTEGEAATNGHSVNETGETFDLTIDDVSEHLVCTISYTDGITP